jgi:hypothetical protein
VPFVPEKKQIETNKAVGAKRPVEGKIWGWKVDFRGPRAVFRAVSARFWKMDAVIRFKNKSKRISHPCIHF